MLGQTLIVTSGVGWTRCEGGPKTEIRAGDVIWCPCQRRQWHGAIATTAMSHVAITEALDGVAVAPVTDEQYLADPVRTDRVCPRRAGRRPGSHFLELAMPEKPSPARQAFGDIAPHSPPIRTTFCLEMSGRDPACRPGIAA
jgi:hypothetical protein